MQLNDFFKTNNIKPTPWAESRGISTSVISRVLNGGGISLENAVKIEIETGGQVKAVELLNHKSEAPYAKKR